MESLRTWVVGLSPKYNVPNLVAWRRAGFFDMTEGVSRNEIPVHPMPIDRVSPSPSGSVTLQLAVFCVLVNILIGSMGNGCTLQWLLFTNMLIAAGPGVLRIYAPGIAKHRHPVGGISSPSSSNLQKHCAPPCSRSSNFQGHHAPPCSRSSDLSKLTDDQIVDDWNYAPFPNMAIDVFADSMANARIVVDSVGSPARRKIPRRK